MALFPTGAARTSLIVSLILFFFCLQLPSHAQIDKFYGDASSYSPQQRARTLLILQDYHAQVMAQVTPSIPKIEVFKTINSWAYAPSPPPQIIEALVANLDFDLPRIGSLSLGTPATHSLWKIGMPAVPIVVNAIATSSSENKMWTQQAGFALVGAHLQSISRGNYPEHFDFYAFFVSQYASDYYRQTSMLRDFIKYLPASSKSIRRVPAVTTRKSLTGESDEEERVARLARILELQDVLWDESKNASEARSIAAIDELARLHAIEAAPALADKLDWQVWSGLPEDKFMPPINAAILKGKVSPAITKAAKRALKRLGAAALPAIIDASAMQYRLPRFRQNALDLIVQLSGGTAQARKVLEAAAQSDEAKRERLFAWLKEFRSDTGIADAAR